MLKTHVRVVPACTGFPACHTPHTPHTTHHTTTHHNNTTTTPHGDRHRERQRQGEKRRRKRRRQENIREKREQRRFIFSMVVHGSSLLIECFFLVNPICARDLSLLNRVKYGSSLISFSASWPFNHFFCELFILCSYSFHFLKNFFLVMQFATIHATPNLICPSAQLSCCMLLSASLACSSVHLSVCRLSSFKNTFSCLEVNAHRGET